MGKIQGSRISLGFTRFVLAAFTASVLFPAAAPRLASAEDRDVLGNSGEAMGSIDPGFDPTMPPGFNSASVANQGQLFASCNQGLQSTIMQGLDNLGNALNGGASSAPAGNGFGINTVCPGNDEAPSTESLTCDSITDAKGEVNTAILKKKEAEINAALAAISCKRGKFLAIKGELGCLATQADILTQQLTSIQGAYQQNIQRMQQDVGKIDEVVQDRLTQANEVMQRLGGSTGMKDKDGNEYPGNGSKGLLGVRDGLCAALTGMACGNTGGGGAPDLANSIPGQIQKIKQISVDIKNKQTASEEFIAQRKMGLASECFNTRVNSQMQCKVNGESVTPKEYFLCMYRQRLGINASGTVENSAFTQGAALSNKYDAQVKKLETVLDQILGEAPQKTPMGADGKPSPDAATAPAATILSAADIEAKYGSTLAEFDMPKFPLSEQVMKNFGYCFQKSEKIVDREKLMASSAIGQNLAGLKRDQDDLKATAKATLFANVGRYKEAMNALTGMNMPIDTRACDNATPEVQVSCLQDLQGNMEALLHGNGTQTTIKMTINGSNPATNIVFSCQGLDGCITALQNVDRNLKSEVTRIQKFKQQYVMTGRQSVEAFTKQMAGMMSSQSSALTNRLKAMNSALASLGAGAIKIPTVTCEEPSFDEQSGLPNPPGSTLNYLGCQMNPKMLDVSNDDFGGSLASVSEGVSKLEEKTKPLMESKGKLAGLAGECGAKSMAKRTDSLSTLASQLEEGNCEWSEDVCKRQGSALSSLGADLSGVVGGGIDSESMDGITAALGSGYGDCDSRFGSEYKRWNECVKKATTKNEEENCPKAPSDYKAPAKNCSSVARNVTKRGRSLANSAEGDGSAGGAR